MKTVLSLVVLLSSVAFAQNKAVDQAVAKFKQNDVRTVKTEIENKDGNPCLPEGKSYQVELQVKQPSPNPETGAITHKWETVKTINVDLKGRVMEICTE